MKKLNSTRLKAVIASLAIAIIVFVLGENFKSEESVKNLNQIQGEEFDSRASTKQNNSNSKFAKRNAGNKSLLEERKRLYREAPKKFRHLIDKAFQVEQPDSAAVDAPVASVGVRTNEKSKVESKAESATQMALAPQKFQKLVKPHRPEAMDKQPTPHLGVVTQQGLGHKTRTRKSSKKAKVANQNQRPQQLPIPKKMTVDEFMVSKYYYKLTAEEKYFLKKFFYPNAVTEDEIWERGQLYREDHNAIVDRELDKEINQLALEVVGKVNKGHTKLTVDGEYFEEEGINDTLDPDSLKEVGL